MGTNNNSQQTSTMNSLSSSGVTTRSEVFDDNKSKFEITAQPQTIHMDSRTEEKEPEIFTTIPLDESIVISDKELEAMLETRNKQQSPKINNKSENTNIPQNQRQTTDNQANKQGGQHTRSFSAPPLKGSRENSTYNKQYQNGDLSDLLQIKKATLHERPLSHTEKLASQTTPIRYR